MAPTVQQLISAELAGAAAGLDDPGAGREAAVERGEEGVVAAGAQEGVAQQADRPGGPRGGRRSGEATAEGDGHHRCHKPAPGEQAHPFDGA